MARPFSPNSSDSDRDDGLEEDLDALRRACMISGASPREIGSHRNSYGSEEDGGASAAADDDDDDDDDDDFELLRSIQERFLLPSSAGSASSDPASAAVDPASDYPLIPPISFSHSSFDSDGEDDLATLRAIQRRFLRYEDQSDEVDAGELGDGSFQQVTQSQLPKSALLFVDALKKNRAYQKFVRKKKLEIEAIMEKNKDLMRRVQCLMEFQLSSMRKKRRILLQRKDPRILLISTRTNDDSDAMDKKEDGRKVSALNFGPENPNVFNYNLVMRRLRILLSRKSWSESEKKNLSKGIKQQYQEMVMVNFMNSESFADKPCMIPLSSSCLEVTPERLRSFLPLVNWDRLASMYLPGRSGPECETRWLNFEDPIINKSPWNALEDKKLLLIIKDKGLFNWIDIAVGLATNRTPFQCLSRYQRSLNPHILKRDWTASEDEQLQMAVEHYGDGNWQWIASNLEGRTGRQCSDRWIKALNPVRQKVGKWSVDEDKKLQVAAIIFGAKNWKKISQFAPGRTHVQCRERWVNSLDPSLNLGEWTEEEDHRLLAAIDLHGHRWSKVAESVPPRTDSQCRRRWKVLRPDELLLNQAAQRMKKSVLAANFGDREKERPLIGPNDFSLVAHSAGNESEGISKRTLVEEMENEITSVDPITTVGNQRGKGKRTRRGRGGRGREKNNNAVMEHEVVRSNRTKSRGGRRGRPRKHRNVAVERKCGGILAAPTHINENGDGAKRTTMRRRGRPRKRTADYVENVHESTFIDPNCIFPGSSSAGNETCFGAKRTKLCDVLHEKSSADFQVSFHGIPIEDVEINTFGEHPQSDGLCNSG